MVNCNFKISGEILDFNRIDDALKAVRTQSQKLLKNWTIEVSVEYTEKYGVGELPQ